MLPEDSRPLSSFTITVSLSNAGCPVFKALRGGILYDYCTNAIRMNSHPRHKIYFIIGRVYFKGNGRMQAGY
jgi:hypothetical protein